MSNFISIGYYLLFDLQTYFLYIILDYKKLKFKYLIVDVTINIWFWENFARIKDIIKKMLSYGEFVKIHIQ